MKKVFAGMIAGALLISAVPVFAADTDTTSTDRPFYCRQYNQSEMAADNGNGYCDGSHRGRHHGYCQNQQQ